MRLKSPEGHRRGSTREQSPSSYLFKFRACAGNDVHARSSQDGSEKGD